MGTVKILDNCTGCGACIVVCPSMALTLETERPNGFGAKKAIVNNDICCHCGNCFPACRHQALRNNKICFSQ